MILVILSVYPSLPPKCELFKVYYEASRTKTSLENHALDVDRIPNTLDILSQRAALYYNVNVNSATQ